MQGTAFVDGIFKFERKYCAPATTTNHTRASIGRVNMTSFMIRVKSRSD